MKLQIKMIALLITILIIAGCNRGEFHNNAYLKELPSICFEHESKLKDVEMQLKETTDMEIAFKLEKEKSQLKEKVKMQLQEYMDTNEFNALPFKNLNTTPFKITEIKIHGCNPHRINIKGKVKIEEDIKNEKGYYEKSFFVYIKAVDEQGELLGKPTVMASDMTQRGPFKKGVEVHIFGSIGPLSNFKNFDHFVFISKEEYQGTR